MTMLDALKNETNFTYTENGAVTHKTTQSDLYDMFALGAAYRTRSDADVILLFKKAFEEDALYALKCLFYIRDIRGGQGERRFFRVCLKWAADNCTKEMRKNIKLIPEFGRWDDLFVLFGTKLEKDMCDFIKTQLVLDMACKTPSLLAKWMPSANTSSEDTKAMARKFVKYLGITEKEYRKMLSKLRAEINVLERLMSAGEWDKIEFDKIPSKAGMIYRNAFAKHDIEREKVDKVSYSDFIKDENTTVNADTLYPYEVVSNATKLFNSGWYSSRTFDVALDNIDRLAVNKYWDNLKDYFNGATFNGLAVVDTSGSMTGIKADAPINVAISLGLYCAEKANGPFKNHYISFSSRPQLIETSGVDFCDKVFRIYQTNLCENTNIEATFNLVLNTAIKNNMTQDELPQNIIVISDMEFDYMRSGRNVPYKTLMENIRDRWEEAGYEMPNLIFWNVNARNNNIPMEAKDGITFVSGCSPVIYEMVMSGKTGYDLMMDKLNSERYSNIEI